MRLWHKDLITVLPRQQLLGQWRECCLIAKNISQRGTPNHLLVNKIMNYPMEDFMAYSRVVFCEMRKRGYRPDWNNFSRHLNHLVINLKGLSEIFLTWHNNRYLMQCYYNLQEKYDCGGITAKEWKLIQNKITDVSDNFCI